MKNILSDPQGSPIAEVCVDFNKDGFPDIDVRVTALQDGFDNCLSRTMAWEKLEENDPPVKEWCQVVHRNPATIALAVLLLDGEEMNRAAGQVVFSDYVAKVIGALDALWA